MGILLLKKKKIVKNKLDLLIGLIFYNKEINGPEQDKKLFNNSSY